MLSSRLSLKLSVAALAVTILFGACGRSRLSDREIRREQIRLNAETKKRELSAIKGDYAGVIDSGDNKSQPVALHLEVIEAPFNDNGGIDPVMMPQLSGFLKFSFGSGNEYIGFNVVRGEYDPKRSKLELVVNQDQNGEMQLSLIGNDHGFSGGWQALKLSMTGTMTLRRGDDTAISNPSSGNGSNQPPTNDPENQIAGSYIGFANDNARNAHYLAAIILRSTSVPGQGMQLTADLKLSRGTDGSEYAIWKFDRVEFNALKRTLNLRKDGINEKFDFTLYQGVLTGKWSSAAYGPMGDITLSRNSPSRSGLPRAEARSGTHEVCLETNQNSNQGALTLSVTPDTTSDAKVVVQASFVFNYGTPEQFFCNLVDVELDYISGRFLGRCLNHENTGGGFAVTGLFDSTGFNGKLAGAVAYNLAAGRCAGTPQ